MSVGEIAAQLRTQAIEHQSFISDPLIAQLNQVLKEKDATPTVITLDTFRRYLPVFDAGIAAKTPPRQLREIQKEYYATCQIYKPLIVVRSETDRTVLLEFPAQLSAVQTITPTAQTVITAGEVAMLSHRDPTSPAAEQAFIRLVELFNDEQLRPEHINQVRTDRQINEDIVRRNAERLGQTNPLKATTPAQTTNQASLPTQGLAPDTLFEFD